MPNQVEDRAKRERSQKMLALARESSQKFAAQFLHQAIPVLWEKRSGADVWSGLTDNYIKVYARSNQDLANQVLPVKPVEARGDGVWGEISL